ncbi:MAG: hypothetical protein NT096_14310 [Proteobacteria bacterium]|nr:hypothetical protein [Pseudomonadota bacterium]
MKKVLLVLTILIGCLCVFATQSHAWSTVDNNSTCWQCHQTYSKPLYNFVYSTANTSWHYQHKTFAGGSSYCAVYCHTDPDWTPVPTANCANCHSSQTPSPPLFGPFPCYWPDGHKTAGRYNCTNNSCHGDCATVIELSSFTATPAHRKVILTWKTESEIDNAGFNVYRAKLEDGEYIKINGALIPAEGTSTRGTVYHYVDGNLVNGETCYYKLEDIDTSGFSSMHGPVSATPKGIKR